MDQTHGQWTSRPLVAPLGPSLCGQPPQPFEPPPRHAERIQPVRCIRWSTTLRSLVLHHQRDTQIGRPGRLCPIRSRIGCAWHGARPHDCGDTEPRPADRAGLDCAALDGGSSVAALPRYRVDGAALTPMQRAPRSSVWPFESARGIATQGTQCGRRRCCGQSSNLQQPRSVAGALGEQWMRIAISWFAYSRAALCRLICSRLETRHSHSTRAPLSTVTGLGPQSHALPPRPLLPSLAQPASPWLPLRPRLRPCSPSGWTLPVWVCGRRWATCSPEDAST